MYALTGSRSSRAFSHNRPTSSQRDVPRARVRERHVRRTQQTAGPYNNNNNNNNADATTVADRLITIYPIKYRQ